jgi:hypothetical protein
MTRTTKVWGLISLVAVCVLVYAAYKQSYPTITYRYRLTMAFEIDGKLFRNSTVIEPQLIYQPFFGTPTEIAGQALFLDLGSNGAIIAALQTGESSQVKPDGAVSMQWLAGRAFAYGPRALDARAMQRMTGRRDLKPDNMPRLLWFKNIGDMKSVTKFKPEEMPVLLGPEARLVEAFVEMTDERIIINIDTKLPWYRRLDESGSIMLRDGFGLGSTMFIGQASWPRICWSWSCSDRLVL